MLDPEKRAALEALQRQANLICAGRGAFRDVRQLEPRPVPGAMPAEPLHAKGPMNAFGRWLLQQTGANDLRADLIAYAMADRHFPKDGDPEAVRARLREVMADGDMFAAVDDAELDWACW